MKTDLENLVSKTGNEVITLEQAKKLYSVQPTELKSFIYNVRQMWANEKTNLKEINIS